MNMKISVNDVTIESRELAEIVEFLNNLAPEGIRIKVRIQPDKGQSPIMEVFSNYEWEKVKDIILTEITSLFSEETSLNQEARGILKTA